VFPEHLPAQLSGFPFSVPGSKVDRSIAFVAIFSKVWFPVDRMTVTSNGLPLWFTVHLPHMSGL
jgi:hypothetical protein